MADSADAGSLTAGGDRSEFNLNGHCAKYAMMSIRRYIDLVEAGEASPTQDAPMDAEGLRRFGWQKSLRAEETWTHPSYPGHQLYQFSDARNKPYLVHHHQGRFSHRLRNPEEAHAMVQSKAG